MASSRRLHLLDERTPGLGSRPASPGHGGPERQHALVLEPRLHLLQADEAAHHQPRSDEQDERQRDLSHHEGIPQPELQCRRRERRAGAQRAVEVLTRRAEGRHDPERNRGQPADGQREGEDRGIDADIGHPRQVARVHGTQDHQAAFRQHQAQESAGRRQHEALGGELPDEAQTAGRRAPRAAPSRAGAPSSARAAGAPRWRTR